ncbi:hypothetical protein BYT27DRAFT_6704063 [Phlegmacium glaucopus]|nr:hypothetical protein BYT27DRAFT_6704063 [Phlegmacium glaucopus]
MSFLYRPQKDTKQSNPPTQLLPAIENVPKKYIHSRTTSTRGASHIIRRVSSIFVSKKKPDLKLANSVLRHHTTVSSTSFSSSSGDSVGSEDDIRRPSGLGRAVSIMSNRSLPPSPFLPPSQYSSYASQDYQRTRALSSPNLLQSFNINKGKVKARPRRATLSLANDPLIEREITPPIPISSYLPKEVIVHTLSYLSRGTIASCSQVSRLFATAARYSLYNTLNFDSLSLLQMEQLVALLASRRDLTELVSTFICHNWPPFFISDGHCRGGPSTGYIFQQKDALLTATFTLALDRMTNLTSLTLPAFDASFLSHHTAFGLTRLTFMNYTMSESDARALFSWLDGQTNIVSLRFINLEDVSPPIQNSDTVPCRNSNSNGRPGTAPPFLMPFSSALSPQSSPLSANFQQQFPSVISPFSSPNLLPNLVELHATPSILTSLMPSSAPLCTTTPSTPLSSYLPFPTLALRPLTTVSLNITTTLYTGLRPATLMSSLRGISHLCLRFGRVVDRRTFEKVVGAAGGVLGGGEGGTEGGRGKDGEWIGLRSLEVGFQDSSAKRSRRDEALYKALQISLPRYKSLRSLRLFVSQPRHQYQPSVGDHDHHLEQYHNGLSNDDDNSPTDDEHDSNDNGSMSEGCRSVGDNDSNNTKRKPSGVEQILIDSWLKLCPSLEVVTLFSGAQWRKELDDRRELWLSM